MSLNIVLVRPKPHRDSIGLQQFMICEPLELEYLAASLERAGHRVAIVDMLLERDGYLLRFIRRFRPSIVGFTAYLPHVNIVKEYAAAVKRLQPEIAVVAGGVHAEVNPQDFIDPNIDFIVKTNGIPTMKAIAAAIEAGRETGRAREEIAGVWAGPGKTYTIDAVWNHPFPDRSKTSKYRKKYNYIFHRKCATIKTSFGCPYECEFCYCIEIAHHRYLERDITEVVEEIKGIDEENLFIVDDNFLVSIGRIREFCRLLDLYSIKKNIILFGRADFIVEHTDIISLLQAHGLRAIFVGIESFRQDELTGFGKKTTVEINRKAIGLLDSMGIECYSGIITGVDWKRRDFDELIGFLNEFRQPLINLQPVTPIPGTPLYEKCKDAIVIPRLEYQWWDMAHLLMAPTEMSRRNYYFNMIRAYYKTGAGTKAHWYVLRKYGPGAYLRIARGAFFITWQYLKLALRG
jgi:radical SAM superfamily enzyme YgiQ (UPF0313 family)